MRPFFLPRRRQLPFSVQRCGWGGDDSGSRWFLFFGWQRLCLSGSRMSSLHVLLFCGKRRVGIQSQLIAVLHVLDLGVLLLFFCFF